MEEHCAELLDHANLLGINLCWDAMFWSSSVLYSNALMMTVPAKRTELWCVWNWHSAFHDLKCAY